MRDVAGMLRSFDYAAAMSRRSAPADAPDGEARAQAVTEAFRERAPAAFLDGYREGGGKLVQPLLDLFLLEKAAYEVAYEAANRPDWILTPLLGLQALAVRLCGPKDESFP
jgi:maltose alpha-D-glucosyltransferase/alpha-amylase